MVQAVPDGELYLHDAFYEWRSEQQEARTSGKLPISQFRTVLHDISDRIRLRKKGPGADDGGFKPRR